MQLKWQEAIMNRRFFLLGSAAVMVAGTTAQAKCKPKLDETCGVEVPNSQFGKGTNNQPADFQIKVCLPDDVWGAIQPADGSPAEWVFRLVTFDQKGKVRWHGAQKMVGQKCRVQGVYAGTHVFVYVTCKSFTGWLTTGAIQSGGKKNLRSVNWEMNYKWLDENFPGSL